VKRVRCEIKCDNATVRQYEERSSEKRVAPGDVKREEVDALEVGQPVAQPQLTPMSTWSRSALERDMRV
jgi:hypothetical protein